MHGSPRSTVDLDFTADDDFPDDPDQIKKLFAVVLKTCLPRTQIKAHCQSIHRNPLALDKTMPTYIIKICYAFPSDRDYKNFEELERKNFSEVVVLEISLNDVVCETTEHSLDPYTKPVLVCTLEDIISEKLRALLQQIMRNRWRPQDVYDIASVSRRFPGALDLGKVSKFLIGKASARNISPAKRSFDESIRARAQDPYDVEIRAQTREFIPFDEAWSAVLRLVAALDIPE